MKKLKKQRWLAWGILGLGVTAFPALTQAAHSWGGYHWARTGNPFTLKLGSNLTTSEWKNLLAATSNDWNSAESFGAGSTPLITAIYTGQSAKNCKMVQGTTQVCNGSYGYNGWLGLASINITGGVHITQGSAKMNDSYFKLATYNNPNEKRHVICQEVAHTFGLDHQSEDGSSQNTCMDYFSNTGSNAVSTTSTQPNLHDFEELGALYSHSDATATVAAVSSYSSSGVDITDDPASWGELVSQSANGRSSVYERYNRDGSQTLTHVYWTIEAASECPGCDHRYDHPRKN